MLSEVGLTYLEEQREEEIDESRAWALTRGGCGRRLNLAALLVVVVVIYVLKGQERSSCPRTTSLGV